MRRFRVILAAIFISIPASATIQRTFVSRNGLDTNTCAIDQPCRSFGAAILQTNANGEVVVNDSAGYGPVTITKAVAIIAALGVHAGVSVFGGNGIEVNAATTDVVVLRNLYINSLGGASGIHLTQAQELHIDHCVLRGFSSNGIELNGALQGTAWVFVNDSEIRDSGQSAIFAGPSSGTVILTVDRTLMDSNGYGIVIDSGVRLTATNSRAVKNHFHGFFIRSAGALSAAAAAIDNCVADWSEFEGGAGGHGSGFLVTGNGSAIIANSMASHCVAAGFRIDFNGTDAAQLTAVRSVAYQNGAGFEIEGTGNMVVSQSTAIENGFGIYLYTGTGRITGNTMSRNSYGVYVEATATGRSGGGNMIDGNTFNLTGTITTVPLQ